MPDRGFNHRGHREHKEMEERNFGEWIASLLLSSWGLLCAEVSRIFADETEV